MSDAQLFWGGTGAGLFGLTLALAVLFGPDLLWHIRQRRRSPARRGGSIFQERRP